MAEPARLVDSLCRRVVRAPRSGHHLAEAIDGLDVEHHVELPRFVLDQAEVLRLHRGARVAGDGEVIERAPEIVRHAMEQEPVGEEADRLADARLAQHREDGGDLRVEQGLSAHDLEHVDVEVPGHGPTLGLDFGDGEHPVRHVRRHVAAVGAAQVAVLDDVQLEGLDADPAPARAYCFRCEVATSPRRANTASTETRPPQRSCPVTIWSVHSCGKRRRSQRSAAAPSASSRTTTRAETMSSTRNP